MPDIATHILDIVYNSIRALASLIKISILDSDISNQITIEIIDNGCGMDKTTLNNVVDPFYTTRKTRKVGLGIPLFKEGALLTGGSFDISSTVGGGTKLKVTYIKDNIDCPPIGDLPTVLVTLIQANENINYEFLYKTDNNKYEFNTIDIKAVLEDVKINEPSIILWLKDYIKEGLYNEIT